MPTRTDALDVALTHLQRLHADQLRLMETIATRNGLMLGFSLTSLVAVASLGGATPVAGPTVSSATLAFLLPSVAVLSFCYLLRNVANAPRPSELLLEQDLHPERLKETLATGLVHAILANRRASLRRLRLVNLGFGWFVIGVFIYALGVVLT